MRRAARAPGIGLIVCALSLAVSAGFAARGGQKHPAGVTWDETLRQPPDWYGTPEAIRVADNVLWYQRHSGGWPKNIDMAAPLSEAAREQIARQKSRLDSTIDNGATWRQLLFLARVFDKTKQGRFRDAFLAGLDFLFAAEHAKGGWPQIYPLQRDYSRHITFNDGATINVSRLLRDIATGAEFSFVDHPRRARAARAVERTVQMILATQIRVAGRLTAWCAQHDEMSFEPRPARSYEPVSLSGMESVEILQFLMSIPDPSAAVVFAVDQGSDWLRSVRLEGIRVERVPAPSRTPDFDLVVVGDPAAPPLWARFYEIGSNRPMFLGRDGVVKYSLGEIEHERRTGYSWLGPYAADLLSNGYPAWKARTRP